MLYAPRSMRQTRIRTHRVTDTLCAGRQLIWAQLSSLRACSTLPMGAPKGRPHATAHSTRFAPCGSAADHAGQTLKWACRSGSHARANFRGVRCASGAARPHELAKARAVRTGPQAAWKTLKTWTPFTMGPKLLHLAASRGAAREQWSTQLAGGAHWNLPLGPKCSGRGARSGGVWQGKGGRQFPSLSSPLDRAPFWAPLATGPELS